MKYRGYAYSRPFGDFVMPVPAQNSCMREFAARNGAVYVPPQLEHKFENCLMQLSGTIRSAKNGDVILMYSFEILHSNRKKLADILRFAFDKGLIFGFVLENMFISTMKQYQHQTTNRSVRELIAKNGRIKYDFARMRADSA